MIKTNIYYYITYIYLSLILTKKLSKYFYF